MLEKLATGRGLATGWGRWLARVEGTLGRQRDMLDSHRLAPYPELTFHFFGEVWGRGMAGDEG